MDPWERIEQKIDGLTAKVSSIDVTMVKQEANLSEHMRRTAILEETVKPLSSHVALVGAIGKIIIGLGTVAAIGTAIKNLLHL